MQPRSALVVTLVVLAIACSEKREAAPVDPSAADAGAKPVADSRCHRDDNGACGTTAPCCYRGGHVIGQQVDRPRSCLLGDKEYLFCRTVDDAGGCGSQPALDCWLRRSADGGAEIYQTLDTWRPEDLPGFEHCDHDLYVQVIGMNQCP